MRSRLNLLVELVGDRSDVLASGQVTHTVIGNTLERRSFLSLQYTPIALLTMQRRTFHRYVLDARRYQEG